jgi:hypothetical protein
MDEGSSLSISSNLWRSSLLSVNGWKIGQWLLVACILISPIVGINDVIDAFKLQTHNLILGGAPLTRILRDVLILLFYLYFFVWVFIPERMRLIKNVDSFIIVSLFVASLISICASVVYSITVLNVPLVVIAFRP